MASPVPSVPETVVRKPAPPPLPRPPPVPLKVKPPPDDAKESLANSDWRWKTFSQSDDITVRYAPSSKGTSRHKAPTKGPFEVTNMSSYSSKVKVPSPEALYVALFSRPLIQILEQYVPGIRDQKSLAVPLIASRELYFVLESLKQHGCHNGDDNRDGVQVQHAAASQISDGLATTGDEGKDGGISESQNFIAGARAPEDTQLRNGASQPASANQISDAAGTSSEGVQSSADSPKSQSIISQDIIPEQHPARDGGFDGAAFHQLSDGVLTGSSEEACSKIDGNTDDKLKNAEEIDPNTTEGQGMEVKPAAANHRANVAVSSNAVDCNYEGNSKPQILSGREGALDQVEARAVDHGEPHEAASFNATEKLSTKDGPSKGFVSSLIPRLGVKTLEDESSSSSDENTEDIAALTEEEIGLRHLHHLVRFLEEEYADVPETVKRMREKKRVTWDMLWAFLIRGERVLYPCRTSKEMLGARVSETFYEYDRTENLVVQLDVWDFDGNRYRKCQKKRAIPKFKGDKAFSELEVCPASMTGTCTESRVEYLSRGKMFQDIVVQSERRFLHYTGTMFRLPFGSSHAQRSAEKADGRVMVDLSSFAQMNPNYPMGNARPQHPRQRLSPSSTDRNSSDNAEALSDDSLIAAPAIVYGFSFALKNWGAFSLAGLREITFKKSAFEDLIMAEDKKALVYSLVSQCTSESNDSPASKLPEPPTAEAHTVSKKGEGCVFLCCGPPGSGKSLTAESIAESLERPLWELSASDVVKVPPMILQSELMKLADMAALWQAIVLVNDVDHLLEKRSHATRCGSSEDLIRHAVSAACLRLLESNRTVMILTTNRVGAVDDAILDHVSVFLHYDEGLEGRQKLWRNLLTGGGVEGITDELCRELAARDFSSGRVIKNAVRSARLWATTTGERLEMKHVKHVLEMRAKSLESLSEDLRSPETEQNEFVHV